MLARATNKNFRDDDLTRLLGDEYLLSVEQAALYLAVSSSTLNHWRSDGKGPRFVKLCGSARGAIRYRLKDIRAYIDKNTFDSVAEAALTNAMSRVSVFADDWLHIHPFIVMGPHFVVDSAYADRETFVGVFFNPFVQLRWLKPETSLKRPWLRPERRRELLGQYLNTDVGKNKAAALQQAYMHTLAQIPEQHWGGHPDLTLMALQETAGGVNYPVQFSE